MNFGRFGHSEGKNRKSIDPYIPKPANLNESKSEVFKTKIFNMLKRKTIISVL
ncbi:hypothetical protein [Anoxybacter fermentans]|uniref:hypothetical protein n=1 Tax=Anoxybacter fermentans TaxID=1323375 RepID=UPI0013DEDEBD|nr:hypothetical protein [Anoxybacter fermentans]